MLPLRLCRSASLPGQGNRQAYVEVLKRIKVAGHELGCSQLVCTNAAAS